MNTIRTLKKLSIVLPIYNEEEGLSFLRESLEAFLPSLQDIYTEIILVDDGSVDASYAMCKAWANVAPHVKVLQLSRNFGHQPAVSAGLEYATGEAVVIIDADLQDPLHVIPEMIARYNEGYDMVYGQRSIRKGETRFKNMTAWLFYRIMRWGVHKDLPVDTGDFRLVSAAVVKVINAMPESHRFLRGMFAWAGFSQTAVQYQRDERRFGQTKYPLRKMLSFAWRGISSFSTIPIKCVTFLGVFTAFLGIVVCFYTLVSWLQGDVVQGWTSLMGWGTFLGGMLLLALGIIGDYVGKIYEEVKRRPQYIVKSVLNDTDGDV